MKNKNLLVAGIASVVIIVSSVIIFGRGFFNKSNGSSSSQGASWVEITSPDGDFSVKLPHNYDLTVREKSDDGVEPGGVTYSALVDTVSYSVTSFVYDTVMPPYDIETEKNRLLDGMAVYDKTDELISFDGEVRDGVTCIKFIVDESFNNKPSRRTTFACRKDTIYYSITIVAPEGKDFSSLPIDSFKILK